MVRDNALVAAKLRRWETYLNDYRLPEWEEIPNFGLYMEQLTDLLSQYLDYLPPELKEKDGITAATINNYVRLKIMPSPQKRRYYREHIAFLIMILTLKQSLPIGLITKMLPADMTEEQTIAAYRAFLRQQQSMKQYFCEQVRLGAAPILFGDPVEGIGVEYSEELIMQSAIIGGLACLLAEKLLLLEPPEEQDKA